jgi:hypothetical protein
MLGSVFGGFLVGSVLLLCQGDKCPSHIWEFLGLYHVVRTNPGTCLPFHLVGVEITSFVLLKNPDLVSEFGIFLGVFYMN